MFSWWQTITLWCWLWCKWSQTFSPFYADNSLWPIDTIWWWITWSTLVQVMACCLMASSHYLNQCWLMVNEVLWHSPESNLPGNTQDIYPWYELGNYELWYYSCITMGQWVKQIQRTIMSSQMLINNSYQGGMRQLVPYQEGIIGFACLTGFYLTEQRLF